MGGGGLARLGTRGLHFPGAILQRRQTPAFRRADSGSRDTADAAAQRQHGFNPDGFRPILNEIARDQGQLAERIVTTAPDVTVSTNLGPWVNRRGLFARESMADTFKAERIPSTYIWEFGPKGQHFELGIAEANLMIMLSALGLSHSINGVRLLPIGTVYDPFIYRSADQLNYACYQDARFMLVATPSGVTLASEGGAHQSVGTPLVGMAQDGLCAFEPAFVDELSVIMRFAFDYMQRDGEGDPDERTWLRDQTGGSVYLRLSTRPLEQPVRKMGADLARRHRQWCLLDASTWPERRRDHCLPGCCRAGGHRCDGSARGGSAGCGTAGHHISRPTERRLASRRASPPARDELMR